MTDETHNFLVVASTDIGDLVVAQSLFIELKNQDPACRIDVLVDIDLFPLLERMPQVANTIPLPEEFEQFKLADRLRFGKVIRSGAYTNAIVLTEGWRYALIPVLARIPVRTGYQSRGFLNDSRTADPAWTTLQKFVALGLEKTDTFPVDYALPELDVSLHNQLRVVEKFSIIESSQPVLALCPGVGEELGAGWNLDHYARLVDR